MKNKTYWKNWVKAAAVRAVKTVAQTAVATIGTAAAVAADDRNETALLNGKGEIAEEDGFMDRTRIEHLGDAAQFKHGCAPSSASYWTVRGSRGTGLR